MARTPRRDDYDQLPQNVDAERSVLGAILLDNGALTSATKHITSSDFSDFRSKGLHARLFAYMVKMAQLGTPIDIVTLSEEMSVAGELDRQDTAYVSSLVDGLPRVSNVEQHAKIVREKAIERKLIYTFDRLQKTVRHGRNGEDQSLETLLAYVRTEIASVCDPASLGSFHGIGFNGHLSYPSADFLQADFPKRDFLVDGFIPRNGTVMVFSMPHHLKSFFTTALALAATTSGQDKLGRLNVPKPVRTLLFQAEDWPGELQYRMKTLEPFLDVDRSNLFVIPRVDHKGNPIDIHLPDAKSKAVLLREIEHRGIELVILDVARRIARVDLNSPKESAAFLEEVDALRHASSQPAVMLVHHENRKEADIMYASAGSYNLPGWANVMVQFKRKTEIGNGDQKISRVEIEFDSKLSASLDPMRMVLDLHSDNPIRLEALEEGESIAELREELGAHWTLRDLQEVLNVARTNAHRRLKKLIAAGIVEKVTNAKSGRGGGLARYKFVGEGE